MLQKNTNIGKYKITFPIADGSYAETYRVKDENGKTYFLKLINYAKLHRTQFDENGNVLELTIVSQLHHPNITSYKDSGELILDGKKFVYLVFEFVSGETVSQRASREDSCSVYDAKQIVLGVLNSLKYLHTLPKSIIHNEITIQNVMLDLSQKTISTKLIDFGYARYLDQGIGSFQREGLNPFYLAPEAMNGVFTIQSDIYSVGVMLYHLIFGLPPHFIQISEYLSNRENAIDTINKERKKPLKFLDIDKFEFDENLANIICKAIAYNIDDRFNSADEFISALEGKTEVKPITQNKPNTIAKDNNEDQSSKENRKTGNGFKDIAGMTELKNQIQSDVIKLLENPEKYKKFGLNLPNGMLLYGPPGCGKTFFAEKLAEEVGFNFYQIKPSDIQSKWVNASQGNVKQLFDEARKQAPSIIFIDEIDAIVPNRENGNVSHMNTSVVNEFLAQMNNAGESGLFIIGATNLPTSIDPAILRSGRLEQKYYLSPPDFEARKAMFEIYLKNRPTDFGIDYDLLAKETESFVSADIKFLVDDSARLTIREDQEHITMDILLRVIKGKTPSISASELKKHERIRDEFEGKTPSQPEKKEPERRKIGF
ncbi:MAG: AAA family ATPase [bacterium]